MRAARIFVDPKQPHWIVKGMSKWDRPEEFRPRQHRRHQTEEEANAEAQRLAAAHPGKRFAVYASRSSFKVEKLSEREAVSVEDPETPGYVPTVPADWREDEPPPAAAVCRARAIVEADRKRRAGATADG